MKKEEHGGEGGGEKPGSCFLWARQQGGRERNRNMSEVVKRKAAQPQSFKRDGMNKEEPPPRWESAQGCPLRVCARTDTGAPTQLHAKGSGPCRWIPAPHTSSQEVDQREKGWQRQEIKKKNTARAPGTHSALQKWCVCVCACAGQETRMEKEMTVSGGRRDERTHVLRRHMGLLEHGQEVPNIHATESILAARDVLHGKGGGA